MVTHAGVELQLTPAPHLGLLQADVALFYFDHDAGVTLPACHWSICTGHSSIHTRHNP